LIRAVGVVIVLAGLLLVGISSDNDRIPNVRHMTWGAFLMLSGVAVALFAGAIGTAIGWDAS